MSLKISVPVRDKLPVRDKRGQPGWSAGRLAMVFVMQLLEDLTDRQAAEAVGGDIEGKYALGLELDDSRFDYSVLLQAI